MTQIFFECAMGSAELTTREESSQGKNFDRKSPNKNANQGPYMNILFIPASQRSSARHFLFLALEYLIGI